MFLTIQNKALKIFGHCFALWCFWSHNCVAVAPQFVFQPNDPMAIPSVVIIGDSVPGAAELYTQLTDPAVSRSPGGKCPLADGPPVDMRVLSFEAQRVQVFFPGSPMFREYLDILGHPCRNVSVDADFEGECLKIQRQLAALCSSPEPSLWFDPASFSLQQEPTVPILVRMLSYNSKVIVMLCDPVTRAKALYQYWKIVKGDFASQSFSALAIQFLNFVVSSQSIQAAFTRMKNTTDLYEVAAAYAQLHASGLYATKERRVFSASLYRYAMASWMINFFHPGRVIVIDSFSYFRHRPTVMNKVTSFLYNRTMTEQEKIAGRSIPKINRVKGGASSDFLPSVKAQTLLRTFYAEHVVSQMPQLLKDLEKMGAVVVGFQNSWAS